MRKKRMAGLSVGVQSLDERVLKSLGRTAHNPSTAVEAVKLAADEVPTLRVDLIFGLAGLPGERVVKDAVHLLSIGANEVTFYPLLVAWGEEQYGKRVERERAEEEQYKAILDRMLREGPTPLTPGALLNRGRLR